MIAYLRASVGLDEGHGVDWTKALVLFFRFMAVFQIIKGMLHWALLLGASGLGPSASQDIEYLGANIYFAVLDPVAAIGLWMTSSWGGVIWLLAAVSQIVLCIGFAEVYGIMWPILFIEAVAITLYAVINWKVTNASD